MRQYVVVGVISAALFMSGCSESNDPEQQSNESKEVTTDGETNVTPLENPIPGFEGSCEGFRIWTQNQFQAESGGYGARVRPSIDGQPLAEGIPGNVQLTAVGWYDTGQPLPEPYASNPEGIQGRVWYYVPDLNDAQGGWVADAGVRAVKTKPAPGNQSKYYDSDTQAAPRPPECELAR